MGRSAHQLPWSEANATHRPDCSGPEGSRSNGRQPRRHPGPEPDGNILGRYRKVHLPGSVESREDQPFQQLEKRYFEYGDLGFPAFRAGTEWQGAIMGMMICNDRRWPGSWRALEVQLVCLGYNSAAYDPNGGSTEDEEIRTFHSKLAAVAKAGTEDGSMALSPPAPGWSSPPDPVSERTRA